MNNNPINYNDKVGLIGEVVIRTINGVEYECTSIEESEVGKGDWLENNRGKTSYKQPGKTITYYKEEGPNGPRYYKVAPVGTEAAKKKQAETKAAEKKKAAEEEAARIKAEADAIAKAKAEAKLEAEDKAWREEKKRKSNQKTLEATNNIGDKAGDITESTQTTVDAYNKMKKVAQDAAKQYEKYLQGVGAVAEVIKFTSIAGQMYNGNEEERKKAAIDGMYEFTLKVSSTVFPAAAPILLIIDLKYGDDIKDVLGAIMLGGGTHVSFPVEPLAKFKAIQDSNDPINIRH